MGINYDNGVKMDAEYYASELTNLRAEVERLREVLRVIADGSYSYLPAGNTARTIAKEALK